MLSAMLYVERAEALVDNTDSYDVSSEISTRHFFACIRILSGNSMRCWSRRHHRLPVEEKKLSEKSCEINVNFADKRKSAIFAKIFGV
jgi:hypothetical protein